MGDGWSATQVEASVGGGYEVFWSHTDGRTTAHKLSDTGKYQSTITRTIDQHEEVFRADLDGDGEIGLNLVSIETNGSYDLATSNNKYKIIDSNNNIVTSFGNANIGGGWRITQVEAASESGSFEVFWSHDSGRSIVFKINDTGEYQSTITRTIDQHEEVFRADLDGDGLTTIKTNGDFKIIGGSGNDTIYGGVGDDTLDGGTGKDIITTGSGLDTIYLRIGDGGYALSDADTITDFTDGSDNFGLTNGLSFGDLTITQGSGDYANDTIIKYGSEYLAILQNIDDFSLLTEADFEDVDIA
jgi:Ca2+-binding RTX toxin-like protein